MSATVKTINGIQVHYLKTKQFKSILFSLKFMGDFLPDTVNARALLPNLLMSGSRYHPSRLLIRKELDRLYGTDISTHTQKIGSHSVISFDMTLVNGDYLPGRPNLMDPALSLLSNIIYQPLFVNGHFRKVRFQEEKRQLREELEAEYHDKAGFAFSRFRQTMFNDELFRYSAHGHLESLSDLSLDMMDSCYQTLINSDSVQIFCVGDFDEALCDRLIANRFQSSLRLTDDKWLDRETRVIENPREVVETGELTQSRIVIGFRSGICSSDSLHYPMILFNTLLGDSDQAKLFLEIREALQLSYDISSAYVPNKGVLFILAGVETGREKEAINQILRVVDLFGADTVSEEDIFLAKESIRKRFIQSGDSLQQIVQRLFYDYRLYHTDRSLDIVLSEIDNVSLADILAAKATLIPDTIYVYQRSGDEK